MTSRQPRDEFDPSVDGPDAALVADLRAAYSFGPPPEVGPALSTVFTSGLGGRAASDPCVPVPAPGERLVGRRIPGGNRLRARRVRLGLGALAAGITLVGGGVAGALPGPVQTAFERTADAVGDILPGESRPAETPSVNDDPVIQPSPVPDPATGEGNPDEPTSRPHASAPASTPAAGAGAPTGSEPDEAATPEADLDLTPGSPAGGASPDVPGPPAEGRGGPPEDVPAADGDGKERRHGQPGAQGARPGAAGGEPGGPPSAAEPGADPGAGNRPYPSGPVRR